MSRQHREPLPWFDGHLDLTYIALHGRDLTRESTDCGGSLQPPTLTFTSLRAGGVRAAYSTLFVRRKTADVSGDFCFTTAEEAFAAARRQVKMHRVWEAAGEIELAGAEEKNTKEKKKKMGLKVTLAMEGAACLRGLEDVQVFYDAGVRIVSLAWAEGSPWAGGDQSGGDITPEGRRLIARLDELGIMHDVSHLSERAFWTLLEIAAGPVVASHSNCRSLLPGAKHPERHLSDEQIRALAARPGGKIGINLFARFLVPAEELARRQATAADVVRHMTHIEQVAGRRDLLALGSDFDSGFGADLLPADVQGPGELWRLAEALSAAGWSDEEIAGFAWGWEMRGS